MEKKLKSESIALVLLILAFPIISLGATRGQAALWWAGLIFLILGGLLPVMTRYMDHTLDRIRDLGFEFDDRVS